MQNSGVFGRHRNDVLRTVLTGAGAAVVLAIAGWPSDFAGAALTVVGALAGLGLAFVIEHQLDRRTDLNDLRGRIRELEAAAENHEKLRELLEHQVAVAKRESALNANFVKVWGDAYAEARETGQLVPLEALMARMEVTQKAQGLDQPIAPPEP